ncbi:hypothetical protein NEOLEDRAFT_1148743 [Neolentinus lepideus HHB14362 ss-1]|uniref:F-box domain-containing protein n=1 Tax=Neolentinus lepideus HHB14362 ss-1 TaxID=1314782 RepID=A0A165RX13_9AGAM|nr:hypothetical protein NEOLEDRAFT_1148743 [Neolentinus lepideus HHB14362 ss-1]
MIAREEADTPLSNRSAILKLPPEVLRIILDYCFAGPLDLLEPSITQGPNSLWSRTLRDQKSVVRVCKPWWAVGVEFLYKSIALRRVGQIPALLRTLEEATEAQLSSLISSITVGCAVPDICSDAFTASLDCLLAKCPRLTAITYAPLFDENHGNSFIMSTLSPYFRNLTHLAFGEDIHISSTLVDLLRDTTQLKSLALVLGGLTHLAPTEVTETPVSLPYLEHLSLHVLPGDMSDILRLPRVLALPSLRSIGCSYLHRPLWSSVLPLIASQGRTLRLLSLKCMIPHYHLHYAPYDIQPLMEHCPVLEHLVFMADIAFPSCHPTLRWIDVLAWSPNTASWPARGHFSDWHPTEDYSDPYAPEPPTDWAKRIKEFTPDGFPALERVRLIDPELAAMSHLAVALHPKTGGEEFKIHVPGATILETYDMIRRDDNWLEEDLSVDAVVSATSQLSFEESDGDESYIAMSTSSTSSSFDSEHEQIVEDEDNPSRPDVPGLLAIFEQIQDVEFGDIDHNSDAHNSDTPTSPVQ